MARVPVLWCQDFVRHPLHLAGAAGWRSAVFHCPLGLFQQPEHLVDWHCGGGACRQGCSPAPPAAGLFCQRLCRHGGGAGTALCRDRCPGPDQRADGRFARHLRLRPPQHIRRTGVRPGIGLCPAACPKGALGGLPAGICRRRVFAGGARQPQRCAVHAGAGRWAGVLPPARRAQCTPLVARHLRRYGGAYGGGQLPFAAAGHQGGTVEQ